MGALFGNAKQIPVLGSRIFRPNCLNGGQQIHFQGPKKIEPRGLFFKKLEF